MLRSWGANVEITAPTMPSHTEQHNSLLVLCLQVAELVLDPVQTVRHRELERRLARVQGWARPRMDIGCSGASRGRARRASLERNMGDRQGHEVGKETQLCSPPPPPHPPTPGENGDSWDSKLCDRLIPALPVSSCGAA